MRKRCNAQHGEVNTVAGDRRPVGEQGVDCFKVASDGEDRVPMEVPMGQTEFSGLFI